MDVFLWIAGTFLMIVPCVNMGLLSDYKICGDPECASLMSRVQAIKDHHGKDCRFLSFRRGDTIFVYYKLTGRREDLWAGSIDRQFGYFPNDAVQEEQVYSTTEKVVETQESDFLCMDEFGYPIDTTDLDSDNDDEFQKSETVQVHPNTQDTEGPQTSQDRSTESIDEAQKSEENKMLSDAAEPQEDAHKTPATQKEQGGSPSSSWLGSSVTGWLGLSTEEQSGNLREGVNELKEPKAEASLTSSVTDWLGFREETKPDTKDILKRKDDSISSTMTGWLGFGGEKKTEQNQEVKTEPTEMFRSRRMSLDLESDELNKEKKEMGTLDWLGSGLSSRLGFRQTNQDPGKETQEGEEEKEQSSSWIDVGIGGILGLSNDNDASDISKESVTKETENDKTLEQAAEHVDKSGSQVSLTDEFMAESSTESLEPTHITSTEPVRDDSKNYNIDEATDASGRVRNNILDVEAGLKVDHKDVSPPAVTDMSSTTNNLFQSGGEDNNMLDNNNKVHENMYVEVEVKVPRMPDSMGNMNETNTDSLEENKTVSYDEDLKHLPDSSLDPNLSSGETNSNTTKQSEDRADEDEKDQIQSEILGSAEQEEAEDTNTVHHEEKYSLVKRSARGEEEPFDEATDLSVREVLTAQTEEPGRRVRDAEGSNEQRQVLDERREHVPDEEHLTPPKAETNEDNLNTPAITDGGVETEIHQDEEQPVERSSQELTSLHSGGKLTEGLNNNVLEEDRGMILTNITYKSQTPEFLQSPSDAEKLKETLRNQNEETKIDTLVFKEEVFHVSNLKTSVPETEKSEDGRKEKSTAIKDRSKEKKEQEGTKEAKEVGNNKQQEEADNLNKKEEKRVDGKFKEEEEKVEDSEEDPEREMTGEGGVESEKERAQELEELKREEELPEQEDQVRLAGLKESEETKEKPTEEKQEQERQLENVQSDAASPDSSDDNSFTENITMSESQRMGWQEGEPAENLDKTVENQQKKVAEDVNQMFSHDSKEATEDGRSSDDGRRSTAAAPARSGVQGEDKTRDIQVKVASNNAISDASEDTMKKTDATTDGSEPHHDGGIEPSTQTYDSDESQAQASEQALLVESERGGAFGFSFQTPTSTQSSLTTSTTASQPQTSFSPKQESESTAVPLQDQETHPVPPTELPHPTPTTETSPKATPLPKHYRSLLMHMSGDELDGLLELLGRHKLQFLDYILSGSEEAPAAEDQSILSDIERLLFHHMEKLVAPSMKLTDAPQEDKDKTQLLIALQKLETLLKTIKDSFSTGMSDVSKHPDELSCATCSAQDEEQKQIWQYSSGAETILRDEQIPEERSWNVRNDQTDSSVIKEEEQQERGNKEQVDEGAPQKGFQEQILDFIHGMNEDFNWSFFTQLHVQIVSSLPDDIRPGPDLYGVPWEPVIITSVVGLLTFLLFTCRCYSSIRSRLYRSKEQRMSEQIAQLLEENCKVLETLSQHQQEYDDMENLLKDGGTLAQTQRTEHLEAQTRQLEDTKTELERDLDQLKDQLDQQREHRKEQERRIAVLEESIRTFEEETKDLQSQEEQSQTTLKIYDMNSDRLQRNLETEREENTVLQESNTQLRQQVEGWAERVSELEAEMQRCERAHNAMLQDVANKDKHIMSLTDRLLRMKGWDSELEGEDGEEVQEKESTNGASGKGGADLTDKHLQKVQKLIYAAKLNADLKSVDEDKDRVFAKLNDEIKAKEELQVNIQELENEKFSLQSDAKQFSDEVERLQQKLHIMTEMYQENELKLHRMLTVEEKERLQKEEKLNKADKNIVMALEELNNYRKRAEEMEEELEKTKQSYQTQISSHEKKALNNWLAARAAERELGDIRRENALLRQKLTDTQFKLDSLDKDPYALRSLARPLPFRAERSPYGAPLDRPSSETRAFLSPPTLMDGPPARLSPRVSCGPVEPPGGHKEMERSGGPHSDSSSNSPTWERERRGPLPGPPPGPLGPQGYMFPEPGGPMFRRPPPPPGALSHLPPPGSFPPGPLPPRGLPPVPAHPADMSDGSFRENRLGPADLDPRLSGPGDQRMPSESDPRMGGHGPPGPPMIPVDGPFPRRAPYGPPPRPDFYPPRGPGVPPMMPMWPPRPQGMMLPPGLHPPGGPPLPPGSHPNMPLYGPPMSHPSHDGHPRPPQQPLPSPPQSQPPQDGVPSPEDAI